MPENIEKNMYPTMMSENFEKNMYLRRSQEKNHHDAQKMQIIQNFLVKIALQ